MGSGQKYKKKREHNGKKEKQFVSFSAAFAHSSLLYHLSSRLLSIPLPHSNPKKSTKSQQSSHASFSPSFSSSPYISIAGALLPFHPKLELTEYQVHNLFGEDAPPEFVAHLSGEGQRCAAMVVRRIRANKLLMELIGPDDIATAKETAPNRCAARDLRGWGDRERE